MITNDIIQEIRRRLFRNFFVETPVTDSQAANKEYVDTTAASPLVYEGDILTYDGEILLYL